MTPGEDTREQPSWAVVVSKPSAEEVAERAIREAGYRCYLPRYRKVIRGTRIDEHGRRVRPRGEVVMRPLFPGYLFAELHPGQTGILTSVRPTRETILPNSDGSLSISRECGPPIAGVERLLRRLSSDGTLGLPKTINAEIIELIRSAVDAGDFDEARSAKGKRIDIKPGDTVRIEAGPFTSFPAMLVSLDEQGRAQLLVSVFGRDSPTELDADALSLIDRPA